MAANAIALFDNTEIPKNIYAITHCLLHAAFHTNKCVVMQRKTCPTENKWNKNVLFYYSESYGFYLPGYITVLRCKQGHNSTHIFIFHLMKRSDTFLFSQ